MKELRERQLLYGPPGSGKTRQLVNVIKYLEELKTNVYFIDFEDKLTAMLLGLNYDPPNLKYWVATEWEDMKTAQLEIESKSQPEEWIMLDRADLSWPAVQEWFAREKHNQGLDEILMASSKKISGHSKFTPRFDQGEWPVINAQYDGFIHSLLYKSRCNIIMTTGVSALDKNSMDRDVFGLGVIPRGHKDIAHQPHSVFFLYRQGKGKDITWFITTAKDLSNRVQFDKGQLLDFSLEYLELYYPAK